MVGNFPGCCARATNGPTAKAPPMTEMNSRRRIAIACFMVQAPRISALKHGAGAKCCFANCARSRAHRSAR
jgi:hypothetical protein